MAETVNAGEERSRRDLRAFEQSFLRFHGPIPPSGTCPITWQPGALTPVFYGVRDYASLEGAPTKLRIFFPSLDGAVFSAPILGGCGRYPVVLFAHGHCAGDVEHYKKWFHLPAQLARSGYVVVVPELPTTAGGGHPSAEEHNDLILLAEVLRWVREEWEHRDVLLSPPATGIIGHSFGALLSSRLAGVADVACFASLSGVWKDWQPPLPIPIQALTIPLLFIWGGGGLDVAFDPLSDAQWNALSVPKHRAVFAQAEHWDYLPVGQTPCRQSRGPCNYFSAAAADLVTMFVAKYLPPELWPNLPDSVSDSLIPPSLVLTEEQEFFAGGHLVGMKLIEGKAGCEVSLDWMTPNDRIVPFVRFTPQAVADKDIRDADLVPHFTGPAGPGVAWVFTQSPQAGSQVSVGSTVTMQLRTGPIP